MVKKYIQLRIERTIERAFVSVFFFFKTGGSQNKDKGIIKDKQN